MGPKQNTEELTRNMEIVQQKIGELKSLRDDIADIKEFMAFMKEKMVKDERAKEKEPMRDEVTASGTSSGELQRVRPIEEIPGDARAIQNLVGEEKDKTSPVVEEESDGLGNKERKETHEEEEAKLKSNEMNIHACQVFDKMSLEKNGSVRRRKKRKSTKAKRSKYKCGKLVMRFMKKKKQRTRLEMHEGSGVKRDVYILWLENSKRDLEERAATKKSERWEKRKHKHKIMQKYKGGRVNSKTPQTKQRSKSKRKKKHTRHEKQENKVGVERNINGHYDHQQGHGELLKDKVVKKKFEKWMIRKQKHIKPKKKIKHRLSVRKRHTRKIIMVLSISMDKTMIKWRLERKMGVWINFVEKLSHFAFGFKSVPGKLDGVSFLTHIYDRLFHMRRNVSNIEEPKNWQLQKVSYGHFDVVTIVTGDAERFLLRVSNGQSTRVFSSWESGKGNGAPCEDGHEMAGSRVHGYDINFVAMFQGNDNDRFVMGVEDKAVRVIGAPLLFLKTLNHTGGSEKGSFLEDLQSNAHVLCATMSAAGLSQKPFYFHSCAPLERNGGDGMGTWGTVSVATKEPPIDDQLALLPESHDIWLWEVETGEVVGRVQSHSLTVRHVEFSHDNNMLLSFSRDIHVSVFLIPLSTNGEVSPKLMKKGEAHKRIIGAYLHTIVNEINYSSHFGHVFQDGEHKEMSTVAKVINVNLLDTLTWTKESVTSHAQQEGFEKSKTGNERLSRKWLGWYQVLQVVVLDVPTQTTQKQRKPLKTWRFKYKEIRRKLILGYEFHEGFVGLERSRWILSKETKPTN